MHAYLSEIGYKMLADRAKRVAAVGMKEQAIARRNDVRRRVVELVGGIPATTGPVNTKSFDSIKEAGFTIENIEWSRAARARAIMPELLRRLSWPGRSSE